MWTFLRRRRILLHWLSGFFRWFAVPEVKNHLRITIGTQAEAEALSKAVRAIL
jgi:histidinol-phosphate/aromatic aminotransferase/cobyric acid decarboxylase-like protein